MQNLTAHVDTLTIPEGCAVRPAVSMPNAFVVFNRDGKVAFVIQALYEGFWHVRDAATERGYGFESPSEAVAKLQALINAAEEERRAFIFEAMAKADPYSKAEREAMRRQELIAKALSVPGDDLPF